MQFITSWYHVRQRRMAAYIFLDTTRELALQEDAHAQQGQLVTPQLVRAGQPADRNGHRGSGHADLSSSFYDSHGTYDLRRTRAVPDILCMGWRNTLAARAFACTWARRVANTSMREQLSFDLARAHSPISVRWLPEPFFRKHKTPPEGWGCS